MSSSFDWKKTGLLGGIEEDKHQELIEMLEECVVILKEQFSEYVVGEEYNNVSSLPREQQIFSRIFFAVARRAYELAPNKALDIRQLAEYATGYINENIESIQSLIEGAYMKIDAYVETTAVIAESYFAKHIEECYCPCGSYEDCGCFLPEIDEESK